MLENALREAIAWFHALAHNALQAAAVSAPPFIQFFFASRISDPRPWLQAFQKAVAGFLTIHVATDLASGALWIHARRIGAGLAHQWPSVGLPPPIFHEEIIETTRVVLTAGLTNERLRVYGFPITKCVTTSC